MQAVPNVNTDRQNRFVPFPSRLAVRSLVRSISVSCTDTTVLSPGERIHAVAWGDTRFEPAGDNELIPVIHYVRSVEEAKKVIAKENVRLVFCDLVSDAQKDGSRWLNLEDRDTEARRFLLAMRGQYPSLPVVLTEPEGRPISEEEKISFLRRGFARVLEQKDMTGETLLKRIIEVYHDRGELIECMMREPNHDGSGRIIENIYKYAKK